ncbi:MarR family protein [Streptomyces sp. CG 926]|uniref:helix-turn-helix transcriptional regulator n=1 Tax=Streptomyces sp. CG 926 TaxID=1882405 RepID=UPI000D6A7FDF|nr:helix-turn-helix domain-containing protein [Streptomyces sp. CG 926]PWK64436.1 MarR family protein [Streptomyces sp. CG 926]
MESVESRTSWTFVTNHARILAMLLRDPEVRMREMAAACQITERAVRAVITDLESAGYLTRARHGRRNHYQVTDGTLFRHPAEGPHEIGHLIRLLADLEPSPPPATGQPGPETAPDTFPRP